MPIRVLYKRDSMIFMANPGSAADRGLRSETFPWS